MRAVSYRKATFLEGLPAYLCYCSLASDLLQPQGLVNPNTVVCCQVQDTTPVLYLTGNNDGWNRNTLLLLSIFVQKHLKWQTQIKMFYFYFWIKVLVCLYSFYTTHNAHWLGTAESHPELSFPESPKHCICTADMDLRYIVQCWVVLSPGWRQAAHNATITMLDKNVWFTIGRMWRPLLWYCMKMSLTCISVENIKGLILCLASHGVPF